MNRYRFVSSWVLGTDVDTLWDLIDNFEHTGWWRGCTFRKIRSGSSADGVGDVYLSVFRTRLIYTLSFHSTITRKTRPGCIELRASGELEGKGACTFIPRGARCTEVRFVWEVRTTKRWMNRLAPLCRRAFIWNHHQMMREGARGIADYLGIRVIHLVEV